MQNVVEDMQNVVANAQQMHDVMHHHVHKIPGSVWVIGALTFVVMFTLGNSIRRGVFTLGNSIRRGVFALGNSIHCAVLALGNTYRSHSVGGAAWANIARRAPAYGQNWAPHMAHAVEASIGVLSLV